MININKIECNYNRLIRNDDYQEPEIFTKFEDSFLIEVPFGKSTGISLVHGPANTVTYLGATKDVEIGDVRMLMYSPKLYREKGKKHVLRQLFVQFKKYNGEKRSIIINSNQFKLYNEHPSVSPGKKAKYHYRNDILLRTVSVDKDILHAGTMFATGYYKNGNANLKLIDSEEIRFEKPKTNYLWRDADKTVFEYKTSIDGYVYCTCISSIKELLMQMKEMHVGMPIDFDMVASTVPFEGIPRDLLEMMDNIQGQTIKGTITSTIFINVDELEDE